MRVVSHGPAPAAQYIRCVRYVAFVVLLSGCASWNTIPPQQLANYENRGPMRALVVIPGEAYEIDLFSSDDTTLHAEVAHAWTVTQDGPAKPDENPQELAKRLRWNPHYRIPEVIHIPLSSVQSARERTWGRKTIPIIVVAGVALIGMTAYLAVGLGETLNGT